MAKDEKGRFVNGNIPKTKGNRKYKPKCLYCNKIVDTLDKRTKFCNHSCAMKFRFANNTNKPRMKEEYLVITEKGKAKYVHRLIYEKEVGKIPKGFIIHHKDENKLNNNIKNLELMTVSNHTKLHNKLRRGEEN